MDNAKSILVIHAADVHQHLRHLDQILQALKNEGRMDSSDSLQGEAFTPDSLNDLGIGDGVILLLSAGMEEYMSEIEKSLLELKARIPQCKIIDILVDNIPYEPLFITFPQDLIPIRDRADMDSVWNEIGNILRDMFPGRRKGLPWKMMAKYAIGIVVLVGLLFFLFWGKAPVADFSYRVLDPVKGDVIANAGECYLPCKVFFNDKSRNADRLSWNLKDTVIDGNPEPEHVFLKADTYEMELVAGNGNKSARTVKTLKVKGPPFANFEVVNDGCVAPCDPQFKNTSLNATSFTWTFEGTTLNSSDQENPGTVIFTNEGKFNVRLSATNEDGIKADTVRSVSVIRNNETFAGFTPTKVTSGYPAVQTWKFINNSKNGTAYKWDFGDGSLPVASSEPQHTFNGYGTYVVTLQVIGQEGQDETFAPVNVRPNRFYGLVNTKIYDRKVERDIMKSVPGRVND